jgi:predicted O-methyltransferase YrrM
VAIVDAAVEGYLARLVPERDAVLQEMEAKAAAESFPIVGPAVGSLLEVLARSVAARRVLELGSGYGYSAAWWLRGMEPGGEIVLTEGDPARARMGTAFLERLGWRGRFRYVVGNALDCLAHRAGPYDVVFCDIDKASYPRVVDSAVALLRPGGLLVTDNVLWSGRVADASIHDSDTIAIREYLRLVREHPSLATAVVPLRDGVSVSVKRRPAAAHPTKTP